MPQEPNDLVDYVTEYADFLRREADVDGEIPVPLDAILNHFGVQRRELRIDGDRQGLKFSTGRLSYQVVFTEASDKPERRRFSLGHELIELLFEALHQGRMSTRMKEACSGFRKERLCETGAAALLMPKQPFQHALKERPIRLDTASDLATVFDVSFLASLIRMVELAEKRHLLIAWRPKLKPTQERRHTDNQLVLSFERDIGPRKRLRVEWPRWTDKPDGWHVPRDKSVPEDSIIHRAWTQQQQLSSKERLHLSSSFDGVFDIEALPIQMGGERWALSLLDVSDIH
jgi:Zn-dependent peptidase ImmA (M78 family)